MSWPDDGDPRYCLNETGGRLYILDRAHAYKVVGRSDSTNGSIPRQSVRERMLARAARMNRDDAAEAAA